MMEVNTYEIWFVTGSQHLYGDETLKQVEANAVQIAKALGASKEILITFRCYAVVTTPEQIYQVCQQANQSSNCIGLVVWMHTFSPAKMWIKGLSILQKPLAHFHTQFNTEIPWKDIDMDFMNLNQSAHGGREFGFLMSRMRKNRKVIVGHWKDSQVVKQLADWCRVALAWHAFNHTKVARIGDNMRQVAVTEGDKVAAQMQFGFSVNGYGVGDLVSFIKDISDAEVEKLVRQYGEEYVIKPAVLSGSSIKEAARIELGLRAFLKAGSFNAFTDTFEDLHGLRQLPGIAVQRLMAEGYGFGAEGDWKTAALLHAIKVMESGLPGGTSFMEDYTYDFRAGRSRVLGAHMLEICPSLALQKPTCEVHPLGIGGKEDPVRLVFDVDSGPAINVSLIDMGNRFRMVINEVDAVKPEHDLPKLPVARVLWDPKPDMATAAQAWILAGGAHHTVFSKSITTAHIETFAEIADVELLVIDSKTELREFKEKLKWNDVYYRIQ